MNLELSARKIIALLHDPPFKPIIYAAENSRDASTLVENVIGEKRAGEGVDKSSRELHEKLALYILEEVIKRLSQRGDAEKLNLASNLKRILDYEYSSIEDCDYASSSIDRSVISLLFTGEFVNRIIFKHPVGLTEHDFTKKIRDILYDSNGKLRKDEFRKAVEKFIEYVSDAMLKARPGYEYHALWRILPAAFILSLREGFRSEVGWATLLPADTRSPSSTIIDHLYATASIATAVKDDSIGLLYWEVEGKQDYISASRLPRDLWSGSYLISLLTFYVLVKLSEELGPDCIIRPLLYATPLYDAYLTSKNVEINVDHEGLTLPVIPGAVLTIVPGKKVHEYSNKVLELYKEAWTKIAGRIVEEVRKVIQEVGDLNPIEKIKEDSSWIRIEETPFNVNIAYLRIPWDPDSRQDLLRDLQSKGLLEYREVENIQKLKTKLSNILKGKDLKMRQLYDWGLFTKALTNLHSSLSITKSSAMLQELSIESRQQLCTICWKREAVLKIPREQTVAENLVRQLAEKIRQLSGRGVIVREGERLCIYCIVRRSLHSFLDRVLGELIGLPQNILQNLRRKHYPSTEEIAGTYFASTIDLITRITRKDEDKVLLDVLLYKIKEISNIYQEIFGSLPTIESDLDTLNDVKRRLSSLYEEHYLRARRISEISAKAQECLEKLSHLKDYFLEKYVNVWRDALKRMNLSKVAEMLESVEDDKIIALVSWVSDYLAIIKGDGDNMARILSSYGNYKKKIKDMIPYTLARFIKTATENNSVEVRDIEDILGLVWQPGLSYTYTVSRALNIYSLVASRIVEKHNGVTIYSGGDDVILMAPCETVLQLVGSLREGFSRSFIEFKDGVLGGIVYQVPGLSSRASQSFGILFFDAFSPLKKAVDEVNQLMEEAKKVKYVTGEKDSICISYRSATRRAYIPFRLIGVDKLIKIMFLLSFSATLEKDNKGLILENGVYKLIEGFSERALRFGEISGKEDLELFKYQAKRHGVPDTLLIELEEFLEREVLTPRGASKLINETLKASLYLESSIRESIPIALRW